jgi:hypothetical protein
VSGARALRVANSFAKQARDQGISDGSVDALGLPVTGKLPSIGKLVHLGDALVVRVPENTMRTLRSEKMGHQSGSLKVRKRNDIG